MSESTENRNLASKLIDATLDVESVQKRGKNTHQKYDYAMAEDVAAAATKALLKHRILCDFEVTGTEILQVTTAKGAPAILATVTARMIVTDADSSERISRGVVGTGHDQPGDKAVLKAMTSARKYGYLHLLNIPIGMDPEADAGTGQSRRQAAAPKLPADRVQALKTAFKGFKEKQGKFTYADLNTLLGGLGMDGLNQFNAQGFESRLKTLSPEEADTLAAALAKGDDE